MSEERQCAAPWCGKVLLRKQFERSADFSKRRYCGKSCAVRDVSANAKKARNKYFFGTLNNIACKKNK
jgi:hypothetical protein